MSTTGTHALSVRFRGVRGSMPTPGRRTHRYGGNTACVEIRTGNEILILDAGTGIRAVGEDLMEEFGKQPIHATVLVSHTHWDHIQGLPFFAPGFSSANSISVVGAHGTRFSLERALRNQMTPPHFPVSLDDMRGLTTIEELASSHEQLGAFSVSVASLNHPGGCAGFRIQANGVSVAYLPDHEPFSHASTSRPDSFAYLRRKALVEFIAGADLLILDTQYTESEYLQRIGWGHGSLPESLALATDAGAHELALFHHDPAHNDDQLDEIVERARQLAQSSELKVRAAVEDETLIFSGRVSVPLNSTASKLVKRVAA